MKLKYYILLSLCLFVGIKTSAAISINGIYYTFSGNGAMVMGLTEFYPSEVNIPNSVESLNGKSYNVTSIAERAFSGCSDLTSITIPNSVTSIGYGAFENCTNLTSITIPESVTSVGGNAFVGTAWYNNQPDGLVYVGKVAYKYKGTMPANTSIMISNGTTEVVAEAFYNCSGLTSVTIPYSVTSIGEQAFCNCTSLTTIEIPNGVTSIGRGAFWNCSGLSSIDIPNSVTNIRELAFYGTPWYDNQSNGLVYAGKVAYKYKGTMPEGTEIIIEEGTLGIAAEAFYNCSGLISVTIPYGVTCIGNGAFRTCGNLNSVSIPNSVTSIGNYAFYQCSSLTSVTIPESVTSIGVYAFSNLASVTVNMETPISIESNTFINRDDATLYVPAGSKAAYEAVNYWNGFKEIIEMEAPSSITVTDVSMSPGETQSVSINLTNTETNLVSFQMDLTLPDGITINKSGCSLSGRLPDDQELTIGRQPNGDIRLTSTSFNLTPISGTSGEIITLSLTASADSEGGTVTISNIRFVTSNSERITLADATFSISVASASPNITFADPAVKAICVSATTNWDTNGDGELSEAEAAAVTDLGEVFRGNTTITSFNELQYFTGLTTIGEYAFRSCCGLISVTIPSSVTRIEHEAFGACVGITSITIPNNVTSIGSEAFRDCVSLTSVTIGSGMTSFHNPAFCCCPSLASISVHEDNPIYDSRENCNAIINTATNTLVEGCKNTTIPNGVTSIGFMAFFGHPLTSIIIPESLTSIDRDAFYSTSLTSIVIPDNVQSIGYDAFGYCCDLTSITIGRGLTSIDYPFRCCTSLTSVNVDEDNPVFDSRENCNAIIETATNTLVAGCMNTFIPNGVTSIGDEAFWAIYGLTSITIPYSVTNIGNRAFSACNLTDVYCEAEQIPNTGSDVFSDEIMPSATLHVPAASLEAYSTTAPWSGFGTIVAIQNIDFADANVKALCVANWDTNHDDELSEAEAAAVTDLGEVFRGNTTITSFDELHYFTGLTSLQDNAFKGCTNMTSFIIPRNVTSIGGDTFRDCKNLISISVADGNTNYDSRYNCNAIIETATNKLLLGCTNTNIPMGVTSIGVRAFQWCRFTSIDIPNSVSSIEEDAFSWCPNLTSFIIPEGVTTIAPITFFQCTSLTTITIPSSLKNVKTGAFKECSSLSKVIVSDIAAWCGIIYEGDDWNGDFPLGRAHHLYSDENTEITEVAIPEGVTRIEARAFRDAEYITSVTIPNSVIYIGQEAFRGMRNLTSINIPNYGITSIGKDAFCDCAALTSITIPISVTSIDNNAFWNCNSLQKVIVPDIAAWCSISFYNWNANPLSYAHHLYSNEVTEIKNLIIPNGVTSIGFAAFGGCSGLNSVFIPNTVTQIKKSAFAYCSGLTSFTIQNGLTNIGDFAFYYCSSLTDVWCYAENMPTTGSSAFKNSTIATATLHVPIASLESYKATSPWSGFGRILPIIIDNTPNITFADANVKAICVANWDTNGDSELSEAEAAAVTDLGEVFKDNTTITSFNELQYFTGLTSIGDYALCSCHNLVSVTIPDNVTSIGRGAFWATSLTSITIPNSVTSIGQDAFNDCQGLTTLTIPGSVTEIGPAAFYACRNLASVVFEEGVTIIGDNAFHYCNSLASISFPNSVTRIGLCAFSDCSITSLTLPNSVISIGGYAFSACNNLTSVTMPASIISFEDWAAFGDTNNIESVYITDLATWLGTSFHSGNNPLRSGAKLYLNNEEVTDLVIPEGTTTILTAAFEGYKSLTSVTIPNSVTSIAGWAFASCNNLATVTIAESVTSFGNNVFRSCSSLKDFWCYAEDIPSTGNEFFYSTDIASATLHVPAASMEAYSNTAPWSGFGTIVPIEIEEKNYLTMADTEGIVGGTIMVPVCLENEDEITAFQLEIDTPDGVSVSSCTLTGRKVDHTTPVPAQLSNGNYQIVTISGTSSPFSGNEGVLLNIVLTLSSEVAVGDYPIIIKNIELTTPTEIRLTPSNVTATLTVKLPGSGDVNGDGKVTITDAVGIVNYILERPSANFRSEVADLNGDGRITITDAVAVVNRILIQGSSSNAKAMAPIELQEIIPE